MEKRIVNRTSTASLIKAADVVFTFASQRHMDLWRNELEGQLSDGAWENTDNTEWLWKPKTAFKLGRANKVEVKMSPLSLRLCAGRRYRKTYDFFGELFDIIGDRMMVENGFKTEAECEKACKELGKMVKTATFPKED